MEFDYTKWQQTHFDELTPEQIDDAAKQYAEKHPTHILKVLYSACQSVNKKTSFSHKLVSTMLPDDYKISRLITRKSGNRNGLIRIIAGERENGQFLQKKSFLTVTTLMPLLRRTTFGLTIPIWISLMPPKLIFLLEGTASPKEPC